MSDDKGLWSGLSPDQKKAALEYKGPENHGPCLKYCAVVDECNARGEVIERLTRERDEAREDTSVARQSLYAVSEQRNAALARAEAAQRERDYTLAALDDALVAASKRAEAAERKVEKLRDALASLADEYKERLLERGYTAAEVSDDFWYCKAWGALAETEKGDE